MFRLSPREDRGEVTYRGDNDSHHVRSREVVDSGEESDRLPSKVCESCDHDDRCRGCSEVETDLGDVRRCISNRGFILRGTLSKRPNRLLGPRTM